MAKDFAAVNRMELEAGLATVGNGKDELVSKFVKAWENQTARRALKGGTGISMALTLAACGGGSDDTSTTAPTNPVATVEVLGVDAFVAAALAGTLPEAYSLEIADAAVGPLTVEEFVTARTAVDAAQNVAEFDAAQVDGTITVTVTVEDTAANVIAGAANFEGADNVTVSVVDTAINVAAAAADLVDADGAPIVPIAVSDEAPVVSAADLAALQSLAATFVATPAVEDTLTGADGVAIDGADGVTLSVGSVTPGADAISATIVASGTGAITFDFADADDTVTLSAESSITGFTTLAVVAGTVDVTAATIGAEVTQIDIASGIVLTAEQFLALENGVVGGSADAQVTVVVTTAAEAADVIAASAKVSGTFAVDGVAIQAAAGSGITAAQATVFTNDLVAEIQGDTTLAALPSAIEAIVGAATAQDTFVDTAMANADVEAVNDAAADFAAVGVNIDAALGIIEGNINAGLPGGFVTAFDGTNGAAVAAEFTAALADLAVAKTDASDALAAIDAQLVVLSDAEVAAEAALVAAQASQATAAGAVDTAITAAEGEGAATLAWNEGAGTLTSDADGAGAANDAVVIAALNVDGVLTLNAALTLDAVAGTYTVDGATYDVADIQAVVAAANAELAAIEATAEAGLARDNAVDATDAAIAAEGAGAGDAGAAVTAYIGASQDLAAMQADEASFEEGLADYNAVLALDEQATTLDTSLTEAVAGLQNAPDGDPAGLSIDLIEGVDGAGGVNMTAAGANDDDLYIFDDADANTGAITVSNFATNGTDYIYMGTETFTLVEIGATATTAESLGSVSALEIFAQQDGADVVLYVEQVASAGNGTTAADLVAMTIEGITVADITFDAVTGILSADATV